MCVDGCTNGLDRLRRRRRHIVKLKRCCSENYKLDPAWYHTSPGFSWDALLKKTEITLDLLSDVDMILGRFRSSASSSASSSFQTAQAICAF